MRLTLIVAIGLGGLVATLFLTRRPSSENLIREARKHSNEGQLQEALAVLEPILTQKPLDGDAAFLAGDVLSQMN